jgi:MFS family permease
MASVFGTQVGLSVRQISIFVAVIYTGGLLWQYPIGWASDRMDRRKLMLGLAALGAATSGIVTFFSALFPAILVAGFVIGGVANPLYSLAIAHTNDYLEPEDMASASAGLLFLNGVGAIGGPLAVGWMMGQIGPGGFFLFIALLLAAMAGYAVWRTTRRAAPSVEEQGVFVPIAPTATTVAAATTIEALHEEGSEPQVEAS